MHKLCEYISDELKELEKKAANGKLSAAEVQYGDMLAHFKKNLLTSEAMERTDNYSNGYYMDDGGSYNRGYSRESYGYNSEARGRMNAKRDSMGRYSRDGDSYDYSRDKDSMVAELNELMRNAPDSQTRQEFQRFIQKIENM